MMIMAAILEAAGCFSPSRVREIANSIDPLPNPEILQKREDSIKRNAALCLSEAPYKDDSGGKQWCALPVNHPGKHAYRTESFFMEMGL